MKFHQLALAAAMAAVTAGASANIVRGNNADILLVVYSPSVEKSFLFDTGLGTTTFLAAALNGTANATFTMPALFTSSNLATASDARWALIGFDTFGDLDPDVEMIDNKSLITTVTNGSPFTPGNPNFTANQLANAEPGWSEFINFNNFLAQNQPSFAAFSTHLSQTNGFSLATKADNSLAYFTLGNNFGGNFQNGYVNAVGTSSKLYRFSPSDVFDITAPVLSQDLGEVSFNGQQLTIGVVPEPSSYALLAAGLALVGFVANRRRQG